jgi:hypothetical protein
MSRRLVPGLLALALAFPVRAAAQRGDPVSVEVEGLVAAPAGAPAPSRDALLRAALLEAVLEVARRMLEPPLFESQRDAIRAALEPSVGSFVLTFRPGPPHHRDALEPPDTVEFLQPIAATVDARRLRAFLARSGFPPMEATRPSVVLCVVPEGGPGPAESRAALAGLERFVETELRAREFVLIEPGVREGSLECEAGALALARALGADAGVELRVGWRMQPAVRGPGSAIAEVTLQALRADDASELALGRFQGVGHHDAPPEALARALEAVQVQAVDNLTLQLAPNWQEIASAGGPLDLVLVGVTGLSQVLAVQDLLEARLGAERAELLELAPGSASLRIASSLSPGALQDRLAASSFEGFALEPVEVSSERVSLRVRELAPEGVPEPGQIDTQEPN